MRFGQQITTIETRVISRFIIRVFLASESGYYESYGTDHDANYNKATIAHNTLLISSESDTIGNQRVPGGEPATMEVWMKDNNYETGEVIGHEFGP